MSLQILSEDFEPDVLPPADLESIIIKAYDEYNELPNYSKVKKEFRNAYNVLCDVLQDKRGFRQFNYL